MKQYFDKIKKYLLFIAIVLAVLQVFFYFGSTFVFKSFIQKKIYQKSQHLYQIEFSDLNINLLGASLTLKNFSIKADTTVYLQLKENQNYQKAIYNVECKECEIVKISLSSFLSKQKLKIKNIDFNGLEIHLAGKNNNKEKGKRDAIHKDLYPILSDFFKEVSVKKISIKDGYFDFYLNINDTKHKALVNKINLDLYSMNINKDNFDKNLKLFYADSISLKSNHYNFLLGDSIHTLSAEQLVVRTNDSTIWAKGVKLIPEKTSTNKAIFNLDLPILEIKGLDLSRTYFDKNVKVHRITFYHPDIQIKKSRNKKNKSINVNFYNLLQGNIKSLQVDTFMINKASVDVMESPKNFSLYKSPNINFNMEGFVLDSLSEYNKSKIFYCDNIELDINEFSMNLPDYRHYLKSNKIYLSNKTQSLEAEKLIIDRYNKNRFDTLLTQMYVNLPKMSIKDIDFNKAYNYSNYQIGQINIFKPIINLYTYLDSTKTEQKREENLDKQENQKKLFEQITDTYFNNLNINYLNIINGQIDINSNAYVEQDSMKMQGNINLKLYNFNMSQKEKGEAKRPFAAKNLSLNLNDIIIKPSKSIQTISAKEIDIDSKQKTIKFDKLNFFVDANNPIEELKYLKKNQLLNISIDKCLIDDADISSAFLDNKPQFGTAKINKLHLGIIKYELLFDKETIEEYVEFEQEEDEEEIIVLEEVKQFIDSLKKAENQSKKTPNEIYRDSILSQLSYLDSLMYMLINPKLSLCKIDSLIIDSADFYYSKRDSLGNEKSFAEFDFRILIDKFNFDRDSVADSSKFMFANNYNLQINNLNTSLMNNSQILRIQESEFSSLEQKLNLKNVVISESDNNQNPKFFNLFLNNFDINKIDLIDFKKTRILKADSIVANKPVFMIVNQDEYKDNQTTKEEKEKKQTLSNNFLGIDLKNINMPNAIFAIMKNSDYNSDRILYLNSDIKFDKIYLDSTSHSIENPYIFVKELEFNNKEKFVEGRINNAILDNDSLSINEVYITNENQENNSNQAKFSIYFPRIAMNQFYLDKLMFDKEFDFNELYFRNGQASVNMFGTQRGEQKSFNFENLKSKFNFKKIHGDSLRLDMTLRNGKNFKLDNTDFSFSQDEFKIGINDYQTQVKDIYEVYSKRIEIYPLEKKLHAQNLDFRPILDRNSWQENLEYRKAMTYFCIDNLWANDYDFSRMRDEKYLQIGKVSIDRLNFLSYLDKTLPRDTTRLKPNLHQLLNKPNVFFKVDTLEIKKGYLAVEELLPEVATSGILSMNNSKIRITNLCNFRESLKEDSIMKIDGITKLMNQAKVQFAFRYNMISPIDEFYCYLFLNKINLTTLNPYLENSHFAKIESGTMQSAEIKFSSNNNNSIGQSLFLYNDLKLSVNKGDSLQQKRRGLISFIANQFVRTNNPRNKILGAKKGFIYAEPDFHRSFASYWVKSIISGLKSTIGLNSKEQKLEQKMEKNHKFLHKFVNRWKNRRRKKQNELYQKDIIRDIKEIEFEDID